MGTLGLVSITFPVNAGYSRSQNWGWGLSGEAVNVSLPDPMASLVCIKETFIFLFFGEELPKQMVAAKS